MQDSDYKSLLILPALVIVFAIYQLYVSLSFLDRLLLVFSAIGIGGIGLTVLFNLISPWARDRRKRISAVHEIPRELVEPGTSGVLMGREIALDLPIFLPDEIRTRHVHILGATGSGKTESVILNFLKQDVSRGLGSIILDAKGDNTFLDELESWVPAERLLVFDLSSSESLAYDPLCDGSALEAAQRLFSSLTWSEEYYKSKALSALQRIFQVHFEINSRNPTLVEISKYLENPDAYIAFVVAADFPKALALKDFQELSGLRDQVRSLSIAHLECTLSPASGTGIQLSKAQTGTVIYFRLQSLMSPQIVATLGKLIINHLNYLAGTAHRERGMAKQRKLIPIYFDEFASFACLEFADLISKARSAGFALHFSHQSVGDVVEVSEGFLNRITDNAATKIILRINDPDSAEFFARSFGTKLYQKATQRVTNAKDIDAAEVLEEGTIREAHQFRASPDLMKTLPTGVGAVLIAHGRDTPHGGSSVFTIKLPRLERTTN